MLPLMAPVGQLLGAAFACGLSLYGTVAMVGVAARLDLTALPAGLRGLENGLVIGSALVLYLIEFAVDKIRYADSVWDAIHTVIRPLSASLLALLALTAAPLELRIAGSLAAGMTTLAAHGMKAGFRIALSARPRRGLRTTTSLLENTLAIGLVIAALTVPRLALAALGALMLAMFRLGPPLWRAAILGSLAATARLRGFFGSPGWRNASCLPKHLHPLLAPDNGPGAALPVVTRAAAFGLRGAGAYRNGWLVVDNGEPAFLFRSRLRSRRLSLPRLRNANVYKGLLADIVELEADSKRLTLFLLGGGPSTDRTLAQIASN